MNEAIRYDKGLGNAAIYARLMNSSLQYYNFSSLQFVATEESGCKLFMTEYPDISPALSWYITPLTPPAGGPYNIDIVLASDSSVIGNDVVTTETVAQSQNGSTLSDLLLIILGRLAKSGPPQLDIYTAANMVMDIIYKRLMVKNSDLIVDQFVQPVTANLASVTLPTDFMGFFELPNLSGRYWYLTPLPKHQRAQHFTAGTPKYYELRGTTMTLVPAPNENVTVVGQYYRKPVKITAIADVIPFEGLFDTVIQEAIIAVSQQGAGIVTDQTFQAMLYKQIDEILPFRAPRTVTYLQFREPGQRALQGSHPDYFNC